MKLNLTEKIIKDHLVSGKMAPGEEIALAIDQTLTQDSTGTMAYLQFEAMGLERVKTKRSVAYIDHNMLQVGFENADDHKYIQTAAHKYGIYFSRPGNGVCHQVHVERFAVPGETLLGSDSHTPTSGGMGMLAIGAGGLDVAAAMGGGPYYLTMPTVVNIRLKGTLKPFVSAKDIILEILRRLSVTGGVGRVMEYSGPGVAELSVSERATMANMGAELGATSSIFPSDEVTKDFLAKQKRLGDYKPLAADAGAAYGEVVDIDLNSIEPLTAMPHSPDRVVRVSEVKGLKVGQVAIGSCTNGSYQDMMKVAQILKGHTVHPDVSLVISPGSRQALNMLAANEALGDLLAAGARLLETGCGPCIGMGQAPANDAISLRTFNRNFQGRCGTFSASVYLVSPETAAVSAITGELTDPRESAAPLTIQAPREYLVNDNLIIPPAPVGEGGDVIRGPNIKPFPRSRALGQVVEGPVLLKAGDNITTDHIMPSDARLLPYRSNIPHLADYCITPLDADFPARAKELGGGFIVAGENYGQGSSREHAALVPLYLGIRAVLARSFARIHRANLINAGILPLTFLEEEDYREVHQGDLLTMPAVLVEISEGKNVTVENRSRKRTFSMEVKLTSKERDVLLAGGKINLMRKSTN